MKEEEKLKMASTFFIFAIIFSTVAVLAVEGTARGAVPLDTLTFDKVFLKRFFDLCPAGHSLTGEILGGNQLIKLNELDRKSVV